MHAAGNEKIARALGRRLGEDRRFDLKKALPAQAFADGQRNIVAQAEVALHLETAQINVAVFEADFLVLNGLFGRRKGRQARVVQDEQLGGLDLDLAGLHFGIDGVLRAQAHFAHGGDHVLGANLLALCVAFGRELFIQNNLTDAGAVSQVEEDEVAVVAAAVDPAHQHHLPAGVGGAQRAAEWVRSRFPKKSSTTCILQSFAGGEKILAPLISPFRRESGKPQTEPWADSLQGTQPSPRAEPLFVCLWRSPSLSGYRIGVRLRRG